MKVVVFSNAADYLDRVLPYLEEQETANNLIIGLAFRLIEQPDLYPLPPFLAVVEQDGQPILAALMTPPYHLTLAAFTQDVSEGYALLGQVLRDGGWSVPGVRAPAEAAAEFAEFWAQSTSMTIRRGQNMRAFELRQVIPARTVGGEMRLAEMSDLELAAQWTHEFVLEAMGEDDRARARRNVEFKIRAKELYFWQDELPVCMAAAVRPTRHGISIGSVYTPPSLRGRGYASALVAALSQLMLDRGYQFTSLFTDLANPTSNKIYQDIGYRPVCDFDEFHFE